MSKQPKWTPGGAADWLAHAQAWQQGAVAGGAAVVIGALIWWPIHHRRQAKKRRQELALLAGPDAAEPKDEPLDPFTAFVTLMATFLSVNGMWHVFGEAMHLPGPARLVSCSVLEASGFAFMRLARRDILNKRPATGNVVTVWVIAVLSGTLSSGASQSPLEVVIRFAFPLLAVHLCHSWMLPIPTEITLDKLQKGKRAWRYIKANRRVARSNNKLTRWGNQKLLDMEADRLAKRALLAGDDTSEVLREAERASVVEALTALRPAGSVPGGSEESESESEGSATAGLPESGESVVRESVTASVVRGSEGPWSAEGPRVRETDGSEGPGQGPVSDHRLPESASPVVSELVPAARHAADDEGPAAAQAPNVDDTWSDFDRVVAQGSALADSDTGLRESEGPWVRESARPWIHTPQSPAVRRSEGPRVRESVGPQGPRSDGSEGPWSVVRDGEGPRVREADPSEGSVVRGSEGPGVRESATAEVRESAGSEWSDPRWSDETGRMAREIVAEFERDGVAVTRAGVLDKVRERGGSVASAHRSALYAYARSPEVPAASELEDTIDHPEGIEGLAEMLAAKKEG